VVVLDDEIGSAIEITSLSWNPSDTTHAVTFDELTIYIGRCNTDELGTDFEANYLPGSKILVYNDTNLSFEAGTGWFSIDLDTPYFYDGTQNLIIDVEWPDGSGEIYTYNWYTGANRALSGAYGAPSGNLEQTLSHLLLNGTLALNQSTFGRIKTLFSF